MTLLYDKPVQILIQEMLAEFEVRGKSRFTRDELIEWFSDSYPKVKKTTINSHLKSLSTNSLSRVHNHVDASDDILFQIDRNTFRRYDPATDPMPIYKKEVGPSAGEQLTQELRAVEECLNETGEFDPNNEADARRRVLASIVRRQGQSAFRSELLVAYKGNCCITGCAVERVLDASHIMPYRGDHTDHVANGLLLRTDLHTLFDLGQIAIDPRSFEVLVSDSLNGTCYEEFQGVKISLPSNPAQHPDARALENHLSNNGFS